MSLEQAKRILHYFPSATHLGFAGFGEPLLVNDLFKINTEFKKRPMKTSIITNGTLLLDRIDDILRADFHRISVSINSIDAIDYKLTCGGNDNTFNNVIKGIQLLVHKRTSEKPVIRISFVLTRDLFNRTQEIINFAEDINVDYLDLHNLIAHDSNEDFTGMLTTDDKEVVSKLSEWSKKKYTVRVGWPTLVKKGLEKPNKICKPLWNWLGIDVDGNTAGCHKVMSTGNTYGNLFQEGRKIWNNDFRKKLRNSFLQGNDLLFDFCKTCTEIQP